jgi:SH3-like domain-containing protein
VIEKSAMAIRRILATGLLLAAAPAFALDYLSVAEPAVLFDAPSAKAKPIFVIARDTPVERVVVVGAWVKVRDNKGDLVWIEKQSLSEKRTLMVRVDRAIVRSAADEKAATVFEAERDVVLDLLEVAPGGAAGWAKVKHRDGPSGYVKVAQVWGL